MAGKGKSINLLRDRKRLIRKRRLLAAKIQFAALLLLVAYVTMTFGVVTIRGIYLLQSENYQENIDIAKSQIDDYVSVETKQLLLSSKLALLEEFFSRSFATPEFMKMTIASTQGTVDFENAILGTDYSEMEIAGESPDIVSLGEYLSGDRDRVSNEVMSAIRVESLQRNLDASYTFSMVYRPSEDLVIAKRPIEPYFDKNLLNEEEPLQ